MTIILIVSSFSGQSFYKQIMFRKRQEAAERCPPGWRHREGRVSVHQEPGEGPELPQSREQGESKTSILSDLILLIVKGMEDDSCQSSTPKALTGTPLSKNAPPQVCEHSNTLNVIDEFFNKSG